MSNRKKIDLGRLARVQARNLVEDSKLRPRYGDGRTEAQEHADDRDMIRDGLRAAFPDGETNPE